MAVEKALFTLREQQPQQEVRRVALEHERVEIETRQTRLTDAIARGEAIEALLTALKAEEARKRHVEAEIAQLAGLETVASLEASDIAQNLKARLADLTGLLSREVPQARQALRKVLVNRLEVMPIEGPAGRGVRFTGPGHYGRLLAGTSGPPAMVAVDRNNGELTPHLFFEIKGFAAA
jgi:hypothetical protein